ncbi:RNA polymerase sigma factor [Glutamicibacter uratoxydans]|uniref:RNA polymerase sigma factor n=1 Tax=Glutamicibacter uratoxydans TaxID=43667 RepID=A0A4Y4DMI9_GLUUR|nr:sigma-70 family RNA polymerase sigma factor [Glutamicibacter uratoxydans]GED04855.1 RNA polymerase sigma factor [Glutamicibacter uratoxydans]
MADTLQAWADEQPRLTMLAYNMLGVWAEAQDVVSAVGEQVLGAKEVRNPAAYLTTLTTRRAIDVLRSARATRTQYIGPWLPEPVDERTLPEDAAIRSSMLRVGLLHILEQLPETARAAYVLHHALGYTAPQIAQVLGSTPAAVRQMLHRAKAKLDAQRATEHDPAKVAGMLDRIIEAINNDDAAAVASLLHDGAVLYNDGGGIISAARNPVFGSAKVTRFLLGVAQRNPGRVLERRIVNGEPAVLFTLPYRTDLLGLELDDGRIRTLWQICNPHKLGSLGLDA